MSDVRLYDIRLDDHPGKGTFRTLQVAVCDVCGARTNRLVWSIAGSRFPSLTSRIYACPHAATCWHHEIEEKVRWAEKPHPAEYAAALAAEIAALREKYAGLVAHDIEGDPGEADLRHVTNTFAFDQHARCGHPYCRFLGGGRDF